MNGKRAKRLRREASQEGRPTVKYNDYYPPKFDVKYFTDPVTGAETNHVESIVKTLPGKPRVLSDCDRRDYKDLKYPSRVERREHLRAMGISV